MAWPWLTLGSTKLLGSVLARSWPPLHRPPFLHFGRKQSGQLFRRRADGHRADGVEVCLDRWIAQGGDRINVDFVDDRWQCPSRNEEREPSRHVETRHASLRNARQLRCQLAALGGSHRKSANLAAPYLFKHPAAADLQVDPPGDRIRERGSIAPIWYVRHLDACDLLEQLVRQVRHGPYPGRGERDFTFLVSGECDEFRDRSRG